MGRRPKEHPSAGEFPPEVGSDGVQIDPLLKDIICALLAGGMHRGNPLDDNNVIKTACRIRQALTDEKLAEPAIHAAKS
jgi:hypothetical protein